MTQEQFIASRRARWDELESLVRTAQRRGAAAIPLEQLRRLAQLYRQAADDLARARTFYAHGQVTLYLNQLVSTAHGVVYAPPPRSFREVVRQFTHEVPRAVRAAWRPVLLAVALMAGTALAGAVMTYWNEAVARTWLPEGFQEIVPSRPGEDVFAPEERAVMATYIFFNNARVAILAWGLGLTMGIGTAYVLVQNGLMVGILGALFYRYEVADVFWTLVFPHGFLELLVICLGAAAGFMLAGGLIRPGRQTRGAAAIAQFRRSLPLLLAAVVYLLVAAAIEGFFTPILALPLWFKLAVGTVAGLAAILHWLLGGREAEAA